MPALSSNQGHRKHLRLQPVIELQPRRATRVLDQLREQLCRMLDRLRTEESSGFRIGLARFAAKRTLVNFRNQPRAVTVSNDFNGCFWPLAVRQANPDSTDLQSESPI